MRRMVVIAGIILSTIAVFMAFWGYVVEEYFVGALGILLLFVSVPLALIGLVLKSKEKT